MGAKDLHHCARRFRFFETLSFLPPLSQDEIARQVEYIVNNGWTPCLEFANPDEAYVSSANCVRFGVVATVRIGDHDWGSSFGHRRPVTGWRRCIRLFLHIRTMYCDACMGIVMWTGLRELRVVVLCDTELLRQQVLDHVEVAHVWVHRLSPGFG